MATYNRCSGKHPAALSIQLTHCLSHLSLWVPDIVPFIQDDPLPEISNVILGLESY